MRITLPDSYNEAVLRLKRENANYRYLFKELMHGLVDLAEENQWNVYTLTGKCCTALIRESTHLPGGVATRINFDATDEGFQTLFARSEQTKTKQATQLVAIMVKLAETYHWDLSSMVVAVKDFGETLKKEEVVEVPLHASTIDDAVRRTTVTEYVEQKRESIMDAPTANYLPNQKGDAEVPQEGVSQYEITKGDAPDDAEGSKEDLTERARRTLQKNREVLGKSRGVTAKQNPLLSDFM